MNIALITTCTKKKLGTAFAYLRNNDSFENMGDLAQHWSNMLKACPDHKKMPAKEMYRGRGFRRAINTVSLSQIAIISAGLGLVSAEDMIIPYNLTTSVGSPNHVKNHLLGRFDATDWWNYLCQINNMSLAKMVEGNPNTVFVFALSRAYLEMVNDDLLSLSEDDRKRIRIVGNDLEQASDFELFDYIMPYDLRLNALTNYGGGKIDFAQRAASHLIKEIIPKNPNGSASEHQQEVFRAMESIGSMEDIRKSESIPNEDLRSLLIDEWNSGFGKPSRLLQIVRKKHGFSCSEQRLNGVYKEIKDDIAKGIDVFAERKEELEEEAA